MTTEWLRTNTVKRKMDSYQLRGAGKYEVLYFIPVA